MKVFVPGGNGFLGKHVVAHLKERGHEAIVASKRDGFDLTDLSQTIARLKEVRPQAVINCAAHVGSVHYVTQYAATVVDENMRIVLNLFRGIHEAIPGTKLINPISNCSYPGEADIHVEEQWWNGPIHKSVLSYGAPRRMIGVLAECYAMQYGVKTVNYLVPNAYGPGDYTDTNKTHALNGMILRMLKAQDKKESTFEIWGTGKPEREWIFIKDLARMLVHAVEHEDAQVAPINLAQNKAYAIRETAEIIQKTIGYQGTLVYNTHYQDGAMHKVLDDTLFRKKYPEFRFTPMADGIRETVSYYKKNLGVNV
jgi:GDP-L-fucose synthase